MDTDTGDGRSKAERAIDLVERGWSYRRIARVLGIGKSTVCDYVSGEYGDGGKVHEKREQLQAIERARLDRIARRLDRALRSPDDKIAVMAGATLVKVSESRRKLDGLDAPTKLDVKDTTEQRKRLAEMSAEQRIELHEKAIAEERQKLQETRH